jgi:hypothetical protein
MSDVYIESNLEPTDAPMKMTRAPKEKAAVADKRVKIILSENDEIPPGGQFFGINGRGYMLQPGVEASVPVGIVNILEDAIISVAEKDRITQQITGTRQRLRFPYRVVG